MTNSAKSADTLLTAPQNSARSELINSLMAASGGTEATLLTGAQQHSAMGLKNSLITTQPPKNTLLEQTGRGVHFGGSSTPTGMASLGLLGSILADSLPQTLLGATSAPKWIYVIRRFQGFLANLDLTPAQRNDGVTKIHGVVSCLNTAYYGHNSNTANAFLIGSWAKKTDIRPPRDIDLYFVLPYDVYQRFQAYSPLVNRQSALLQEVKSKLLGTNPLSHIKGDETVVTANFLSYGVEVVPAFALTESHAYWICDTKNGGSYKKAMPLHEVDAIEYADSQNNKNVRPLIRMLKAWQENCTVPIKSFHLELLAVEFLNQWPYRQHSHFYYDWMCRDFFAWLIARANTYLMTPGTYDFLFLGDDWKSRAESAYQRALKACDFEQENEEGNAGDEWQKIFGTFIPKYV